jgi:hypothetical protein
MQVMDCRNFKEMLDSYLCGELAVETNHAILRHAEHCGTCRDEMAARRHLRDSLRRACSRETMSAEAIRTLRDKLRADAADRNPEMIRGTRASRRNWLSRFFETRMLMPVAAATALILLAGGAWSLYVLHQRGGNGPEEARIELTRPQVESLALSEGFLVESADDHRYCATKFVNATAPAEMPDSVRDFDPACVRLDKVAAPAAKGLILRSAHVCNSGQRRFAHLVYTRDEKLISLLVARRDERSMNTGSIPPFDGTTAGFQPYADGGQNRLSLGTYQTAKRIVLVVSDLPEQENLYLAERLAKPVVEHLISDERKSSTQFLNRSIEKLSLRVLIASLIRI